MNRNKLLLLNGPRGCGKDTLFAHLKTLRPRLRLEESSCKQPLIEAVCDWFGITETEWRHLYTSARKLKPSRKLSVKSRSIQRALNSLSQVSAHFSHILLDPKYSSQREGFYVSPVLAMILVSEAMHKPGQGNDYFGIERARRLPLALVLPSTLFVDTSCGFQEELSPRCLKELSSRGYREDKDILLLQIRGRGPQDFAGDSRQWVNHSNMEVIENVGTEEEFLTEATNIILDWIEL